MTLSLTFPLKYDIGEYKCTSVSAYISTNIASQPYECNRALHPGFQYIRPLPFHIGCLYYLIEAQSSGISWWIPFIRVEKSCRKGKGAIKHSNVHVWSPCKRLEQSPPSRARRSSFGRRCHKVEIVVV